VIVRVAWWVVGKTAGRPKAQTQMRRDENGDGREMQYKSITRGKPAHRHTEKNRRYKSKKKRKKKVLRGGTVDPRKRAYGVHDWELGWLGR